MELSKEEKVLESLDKLKNKENKFYFFVLDSKGYAKASVRYIYDFAMAMNNHGYKPVILHEKDDYVGVGDWMGESFTQLEHLSLESQKLEVGPEDFIFIPEIFGHVMEQVSKLPCGKIVLSQSYDFILETIKPGTEWTDYGFYKCITTTEKQQEFIKDLMRNVSVDVVEPTISDVFVKKTYPSKPIISIHTRDQRDTMVIIKTFYIRYPQYRWITFRDMRGIDMEKFSEYLQDSFVSVWIDDQASFGTYPLESMACGTPVIGKVPNMKPEWMNDDNGIWYFDKLQTVDIIADYIQNWLEDNISDSLYESGYMTSNKYLGLDKFNETVSNLIDGYIQSRIESFESQINVGELQEL